MKYNYCMLGAKHDGTADKGVLVGYNKRFCAYSCSIYQLKEPIRMGDSFDFDNIAGEIYTLSFCDEKSLDGFIDLLTILKGQMEAKHERHKRSDSR